MAAEKKERPKKKQPVNWARVGAIVIGVFFVVVMVVSTLGTNWVSSLNPAKTGDTVTVDYTMYSEDGRPVVTTNQQVVQQGATKGLMVFLAQPMQLTAGGSMDNQLVPVRVNHKVYGWTDYSFFSDEINAMQKAVIGAKSGDTVDVKIPNTYMMVRPLSAREYAAMGGNISDTRYGEQLVLGFSDAATTPASNSSKTRTYVRVGYISEMKDDNLTVNYGAKTISTTVRDIKAIS
jgi:hypothetical protein